MLFWRALGGPQSITARIEMGGAWAAFCRRVRKNAAGRKVLSLPDFFDSVSLPNRFLLVLRVKAAFRFGDAEILIGEVGGDASAGGALDEAALDEVGFVNVLDRVPLLGDGAA